MKRDICQSAVQKLRFELFQMNGCIPLLCRDPYTYFWNWPVNKLVKVVMQTRKGLDPAKVEQMVTDLTRATN